MMFSQNIENFENAEKLSPPISMVSCLHAVVKPNQIEGT